MKISVNTPRLKIRNVRISDASFILILLNTEGWLKFIGDRNVNTLEEAKAYIKTIQKRNKFYYLTVLDFKSRKPLGIVSYLKRDTLPGFDLGFAFLPESMSKGFAFEAAHALIKHIKTNIAVEPLYAVCHENNVRSQDLLSKLGFLKASEIQPLVGDLVFKL